MVKKHVTGGFAKSIAWPEEAIMEGQRAVGFTMKELKGAPLNTLLSNDECFKVPWDIRLRICSNVALLVDALHRAGVVFGDLHADNLAFLPSGDVYLYDADSLQISFGDRTFHCTVAHHDCRPPELDGVNLSATPKLNKATDNYMLANLIFRLLMGSHPFPGINAGVASTTSTNSPRVNDGDFVFELRPDEAPAYSAPYEVVGRDLRALFKRAFVKGANDSGARPEPNEWATAIGKLLYEKMARCPTHGPYPKRVGNCPFCKAKAPSYKLSATTKRPLDAGSKQPVVSSVSRQAAGRKPKTNNAGKRSKASIAGTALLVVGGVALAALAIYLLIMAIPYLLAIAVPICILIAVLEG